MPAGWTVTLSIGAAIGAVVLGVMADRRSSGRRSGREAASEVPSGTAPTGPTIGGRYRLVRTLGRGGTGTVHLADDLQQGRPVAIKTLGLPRELGEADRDDARARFVREAGAARRLDHPDIVRLYDAGEHAGQAYIAMELLAGTNLLAHTRAPSLLPTATVLRTVARIALALDHAHRAGVVHRDIKPANVMWDAATDTVKVMDFGIASVADAERTRTGVLLGTPFYMSPEQIAGSRVDGRSDLYSLGVLLFELLTGSLPYGDGGTAALLRHIATTPAPDLRERRPDLPAALADVVALALQKRPALRYADGRGFAADLLEIAGPARPGIGT